MCLGMSWIYPQLFAYIWIHNESPKSSSRQRTFVLLNLNYLNSPFFNFKKCPFGIPKNPVLFPFRDSPRGPSLELSEGGVGSWANTWTTHRSSRLVGDITLIGNGSRVGPLKNLLVLSAGNLRAWSISSLVIIIPATPTTHPFST